MTSLINPELNNKNVFSQFSTNQNSPTNAKNYYIPSPQNLYNTNPIKQEKKSHALGYSIAITTLIAGFGVLALMKGLPKGSYGKLNKMFEYFDEKVASLTQRAKDLAQKNQKLPKAQELALRALKIGKSVTNKVKFLYNTGPLKDILFKKGLEKTPVIKKVGPGFTHWVTNLFEKISIKRSKNSYKHTLNAFEDMYTKFTETNANLLVKKGRHTKITIGNETKALQDWLKEIQERSARVKQTYDLGFNGKARLKRLRKLKIDFNGGISPNNAPNPESLDQKVWDLTYKRLKDFFKSKEAYETFISEELAAPIKMNQKKSVDLIRRLITSDIKDNFVETQTIIKEVEKFIKPEDKKSRTIISELRKILKKYNQLSGPEEKINRIKLEESISENLSALGEHISKENHSADSAKVSEYLEQFGRIINKNKKGELQEILTIYKHIAPEEYTRIKKQTYKSINSLDKSINMETDKLFDKLRDLKIGSAPTDALGVFASLGAIIWGLTKAENKDEKISVSLKYGIPALGAVLTSLYCTVALVSGGQALLFGMISGLAINKLGVIADNTRKRYKEKTLTIKNIAKDNLPQINLNQNLFNYNKR